MHIKDIIFLRWESKWCFYAVQTPLNIFNNFNIKKYENIKIY